MQYPSFPNTIKLGKTKIEYKTKEAAAIFQPIIKIIKLVYKINLRIQSNKSDKRDADIIVGVPGQ